MQISARCRRNRPLKSGTKTVREYLYLETIDGIWNYHVAWRERVHVANPNNLGMSFNEK